MQQHIGISGQFRIVKKSKDGDVLFDSGQLNNLLLDTGLDYFGDNAGGSNILSYLAIGTGNSEPQITQNRLDNIIKIASGEYYSKKDDYNESRDGNYFTAIQTYKYRFENLNNINISEIGLVDNYYDTVNYAAYTRALIKDEHGRPLTITVLQGEILDIFYSLKQVFHLHDKQFRLLLSDGRGGNRGYVDCLMRLCGVGGLNLGGSANYGECVGRKFGDGVGNNAHVAFDSQSLSDVTGMPQGGHTYMHNAYTTKANYQLQSHKNIITLHINEHYNLSRLGAMIFLTTMGFYQISFADEHGAMIDKNNTRTFSITLEISWGRDERD